MKRILLVFLALPLLRVSPVPAFAQGMGNSGTITGTVTDPSGAVVAGATVEIQNKVTGYDRTTTTDAASSVWRRRER